jgi:hypothetical protein
MPAFVKLTVNVNGSIGGKETGSAAEINLDHVLKITRDRTDANAKGCKITYTNGNTDRVFESLDLIEKLIRGEPVGHYTDPGEPIPRDA